MPSNPTDQRVAGNVRAEMARRNYSQTSLAKKLGRTQQALSRRLCGQTAFSVTELDQIAEALGCSLNDLIGERASA